MYILKIYHYDKDHGQTLLDAYVFGPGGFCGTSADPALEDLEFVVEEIQ